MGELFNLLNQVPVLSVSLGFALAGFLAWVFKDTIAAYFKKKYNLYDVEEIKKAVVEAEARNDLIPQRSTLSSRVVLALTEPEITEDLVR